MTSELPHHMGVMFDAVVMLLLVTPYCTNNMKSNGELESGKEKSK